MRSPTISHASTFLLKHYSVDEDRLQAILESGSMFAHVEAVPCPLCGAPPHAQRHEEACDGDVDAILQAAKAEIEKIDRLRGELQDTVEELAHESTGLRGTFSGKNEQIERLKCRNTGNCRSYCYGGGGHLFQR